MIGSSGLLYPEENLRIPTSLSFLLFTLATSAFSQLSPIVIAVDLTDAPRKLLHARLTIPVKPGPLTLLYPKWIPGEHTPSGPIANLAGLMLSANGKTIPWQRDDINMFAFHLSIPADAPPLDV